MLEVRIENFEPIDIIGKTDGWEYTYLKNEVFNATCLSKDGNVRCTYSLTDNEETVMTETFQPESGWTIVNDKRKMISQGKGTGAVRLAGGSVYNRYGYFRRKIYQDMLDKFHVSSTRMFTEYGYDTTFILENSPTKRSKLVLLGRTTVDLFDTNKIITINKHMTVLQPKIYGTLIVRVTYGNCWFLDESVNTEKYIRRMYVNKAVPNILTLPELQTVPKNLQL